MRKRSKERMTICEQLEAMREEICNDYCKYPEMRVPKFLDESWQQQLEVICEKCPLNDLKIYE